MNQEIFSELNISERRLKASAAERKNNGSVNIFHIKRAEGSAVIYILPVIIEDEYLAFFYFIRIFNAGLF